MTEDFLPRARQRIAGTGERVTAGRVAVLAELLRAKQALTHHEIEGRLSHPLDRVTLYRVLEWLVASGLAHRGAGTDRIWRFMASSTDHEHHAHFHCNRCGKMRCLDEPFEPDLRLPRGYRREAVDLTVRGRCAACAK